jgi:hypothetical protein
MYVLRLRLTVLDGGRGRIKILASPFFGPVVAVFDPN